MSKIELMPKDAVVIADLYEQMLDEGKKASKVLSAATSTVYALGREIKRVRGDRDDHEWIKWLNLYVPKLPVGRADYLVRVADRENQMQALFALGLAETRKRKSNNKEEPELPNKALTGLVIGFQQHKLDADGMKVFVEQLGKLISSRLGWHRVVRSNGNWDNLHKSIWAEFSLLIPRFDANRWPVSSFVFALTDRKVSNRRIRAFFEANDDAISLNEDVLEWDGDNADLPTGWQSWQQRENEAG